MFAYIFFFSDVFSSLKHYLELYITDTALKVSRPLYCFTTSMSDGVENYIPRLWGTGISDAIFSMPFVFHFEFFVQCKMLKKWYLMPCNVSQDDIFACIVRHFNVTCLWLDCHRF